MATETEVFRNSDSTEVDCYAVDAAIKERKANTEEEKKEMDYLRDRERLDKSRTETFERAVQRNKERAAKGQPLVVDTKLTFEERMEAADKRARQSGPIASQ